MIFIDNKGINDPHINLALEEYALRNFDENETYLLFYINDPSIIIGKNQNTLEEINHKFVEEKDIPVVRRISGGGAVYHDRGNLNFSFIQKYNPKFFNNYSTFTLPVIELLNELGAPAELNGRNDIVLDGKKISGNAQFTSRNKMFSHGTLLYDTELDNLVKSLKVSMDKIESKGIKSVRSRVTNIKAHLTEKISVEDFREKLLKKIFENSDEIPYYPLTDNDWNKIYTLAEKKYRTWDWNYGRSPKFNVRKSKRFPIGLIDARIYVNQGLVENMKIYGDFFNKKDIAEFEKLFMGIRYDKVSIQKALFDSDISDYFGDISSEEIVDLLY